MHRDMLIKLQNSCYLACIWHLLVLEEVLCKYVARLVCILCNVILQSHIFKICKSCIRVKEVLYIFILYKILLVEDKEIVSPILIVCQEIFF